MNSKEYNKQYKEKNKESIKIQRREHYLKNKDIISNKFKEKYKLKKEMILTRGKLWKKNNSEKVKLYAQKNKHKINEQRKNRYKIDSEYALKRRLIRRIGMALKSSGIRKSKRTLELLGCSIQELKEYLEKQFKPGMGWDNRKDWHIDHIKPCSSFNLLDENEQKKCFHYTNLQPLWAKDNLEKSNKYL